MSITILDPSGTPVTGDGAAAGPDGTWSLPTSVAAAPGRYSVRTGCRSGTVVLFEYDRQPFTVTA